MQNHLQINNLDTLFQWQKAFLLLSLDRVTALWEDMGLHLPSAISSPSKEIIRYFVTAYQKEPYDDAMKSYPRKITELIDAMLARLRSTCGEESEASLIGWVGQKFLVFLRKERWYETWQSLFLRLAEGSWSQLAGSGIADEKLMKLKSLAERWQEREAVINARVDEADAQPLSGWDAEQYAAYQHASPINSPLDYLSNFINNYAFSTFWEELLTLLSRRELAVLNRWGQVYTALKTSIPPATAEIPSQYLEAPIA